MIEEADETLYLLEIMKKTRVLADNRLVEIIAEADEIISIFVASRQTATAPRQK